MSPIARTLALSALLCGPTLAQAPLYEVSGAPGELLGSRLITVPDLDSDGVPELAASYRFGSSAGYRVLSGASGAFLKDVLGWPIGDVNGDGARDRVIPNGNT